MERSVFSKISELCQFFALIFIWKSVRFLYIRLHRYHFPLDKILTLVYTIAKTHVNKRKPNDHHVEQMFYSVVNPRGTYSSWNILARISLRQWSRRHWPMEKSKVDIGLWRLHLYMSHTQILGNNRTRARRTLH